MGAEGLGRQRHTARLHRAIPPGCGGGCTNIACGSVHANRSRSLATNILREEHRAAHEDYYYADVHVQIVGAGSDCACKQRNRGSKQSHLYVGHGGHLLIGFDRYSGLLGTRGKADATSYAATIADKVNATRSRASQLTTAVAMARPVVKSRACRMAISVLISVLMKTARAMNRFQAYADLV